MRLLLRTARSHPVVAYFVLAFAISWAVWIPMAAAGMRVYQGSEWPTHWPGLFGPLVAAFVVTAVVAGRAGVMDLLKRMVRWRAHPGWYLVALSPLLFYGLAALAMGLGGQGWPNLDDLGLFSGLPAVGALGIWVLLLGTSFGEETGWRGFAVPQLQKTRGLLSSALIVGVLWALWHLPSMLVIENYRQLGLQVLPGFLLGIVAGSIFLAWLYNHSGASILLVAIWHATFNLVSGTAAAQGLVAAIVSTGVMAWASLIVLHELWKWRQRRNARPSARSRAAV
jgi:uncharacterized protein